MDKRKNSSVTGFPERLHELIEQTTGGDIPLFAKNLNGEIKLSTIRHYLRSETEPKLKNLVILAEAGGSTVGWLATGESTPEVNKRISRFVIPMDYASELIANGVFEQGASVDEKILESDYRYNNPKTYFDKVRVEENWLKEFDTVSARPSIECIAFVSVDKYGMPPTIRQKDVVLVNTSITQSDGGIYFIYNNNEAQFRRVEFLADKILIINDNPAVPEINIEDPDSVKILGKVVFKMSGELV